MSAVISEATGKAYGVERVCAVWEQPRSTFYSRRERAQQEAAGALRALRRRGPKPQICDDDLLVAIREDLESSPWTGEGHRKVHGRLARLRGIRVSRKRVLRLMRENHLLSPHRARSVERSAHDGTITTDAPNLLWGTDGALVQTVEDGWVWIFSAVEHWNGECVGWHVCKEGTRFAALEPIAMGLERIYGSVEADVARGLALRMDHGPQYLSDHFRNQVKFWGIQPSFAFVEQPQTNGVAERFNRTLKEQCIYGRIFCNVEELRTVVAEFIETYNQHWRLEKLDNQSPLEARETYSLRRAA